MEEVDDKKDVVLVNYRCEKCKIGILKHHLNKTKLVKGIVHYLNICTHCGTEEYMPCFYPTVKNRQDAGDASKPGCIVTLCAKECERHEH